MKKNYSTFILCLLLSMFSQTLLADHLGDQLFFSSKLTGAQTTPPNATAALGVAGIQLSSERDSINFNVALNGLSGTVNAIHIHEGPTGTSGGVLVDLSPFIGGNRVAGCLTGTGIDAALIEKMLLGNTYLNVHTDLFPNGEIRGQIKLEKETAHYAELTGGQEVPAISTTGKGLAVFDVSIDKLVINYTVVVDELSGPITGIHLHNAVAGMNGAVVVDLSPSISGNLITGTIDASAFPGLVTQIENGEIYINTHTTLNPGGEIRGQLLSRNTLAFQSSLDTNQETTAVTGSSAIGVADISLSNTFDELTIHIQTEGLSGPIMGVHLHEGGLGASGGVLLDLTSFVTGTTISGSITAGLTNDILKEMLEGNVYINIHTALNPDGEIRGQVYRLAREGYHLSLDGDQEVPMVSTTAQGAGIVSINSRQNNAHVMIVLSNLSGPATGVHFHKEAAGNNGAVIYNLTPWFSGTGTDDAAFGYWRSDDMTPFTSAESFQFRKDSVYVNVHTTMNPNGEIRGQSNRDFECFSIPTSIQDELIVETDLFTVYPNPVNNVLSLDLEELTNQKGALKVLNVSGQVVINQIIDAGVDKINLPTSHLSSGLYIIEVRLENSIQHKRVLKK